ncbi:MAG: multidrug ABC transporter ATP-binding protein [Deltaproteobacteria bacterium RBG_16_54_18]|nr:MAG: multidrug ABC transporter ATP-binding protein [Deltaproteobacteria bacterium RBG_16_54_18]
MEAILTQGLTKKFGAFVAVDNVSFSVSAGEVFGFLGPNGAGKTTTIRMLCGILPPTAGQALVGGVDVMKEPQKIRGNIGYMSQRFSLYTDLTVAENLTLYAGIYGIPENAVKRRLKEVMELSALVGKEDALVVDLPTGWRQRLALGCAVLHEPEVLFLDEPTSGVDPAARQAFWELIYQLSSQGTAVLVTTHYMEEAEQCNRIGMIFAGRLVAMNTPTLLKERIPGKVYEVEAGDTIRASEIMRQLPGIAEVSPFGRRLHVLTETDTTTRTKLRQALTKAGITVSSLEQVAPSLEDVFIYVAQETANENNKKHR